MLDVWQDHGQLRRERFGIAPGKTARKSAGSPRRLATRLKTIATVGNAHLRVDTAGESD